jgi:hypothetical protein
LEVPFTDSGAGTTAIASTSDLRAVSLSLVNGAGTAEDFHSVPGSGVSGLNTALDFSTNADFSFSGGDYFGLGPSSFDLVDPGAVNYPYRFCRVLQQ